MFSGKSCTALEIRSQLLMIRRSEAMDEPMIGASQASELVEELQTRYLSGTLNPHTRELARRSVERLSSRRKWAYLTSRDLSSLPAEELDRYLNLAEDVLLKDRPASDANGQCCSLELACQRVV